MIEDDLGGDPEDQTLRLWAEWARRWAQEWIAQLPAKDPQIKATQKILRLATTKQLAEAYRTAVCRSEELAPGMNPGYRALLIGQARQSCVHLLLQGVQGRK